jgi:hypothetical protein|eukprot:SAG31_NODE_2834_length_5019_cov_92.432982_9_plen_102_part_00
MSSPFQQQFSKKSPINQDPPKLKKRGRVPSEYFYNSKDYNPKNETPISDIMVEDNDWQDKPVNDPKGVLNREATRKEYRKGYRVKREKDGSVTLRGRRGNK